MGRPSSFFISPQIGFGPTGVPIPYDYHKYPKDNQKIPFLAMLNIPYFSCLTNDPIQHAPLWTTVLAKLPSDISKFDGKLGEYINNHFMTFHLWCCFNTLMDNSIHCRIFQRTLTGVAVKWYIELPRNSFVDFNYLVMFFLMHF
jgi:hypothetical protein